MAASRRDLDKAFTRHEAVGSEPHDGYLFGKVHPDRVRATGVLMEARVWAKSLGRNDRATPFMIFGRPRSGSTLLVRLLDQVPGVRCDGELLHYGLISPLGLLSRLPRRAASAAYGVKVLSYQLTEIQRIRRPLAFFDRVCAMGYHIIHLRRDTWSQTVSLTRAAASGSYHGDRSKTKHTELFIDPRRFMDLLAWNDRMLRYEDEVMQHLQCHTLQYETALRDRTQHQRVVDDISAMLGVPSATVQAGASSTGWGQIVNMDQLRAAAAQSPLAHLVPPES